MLVTTLTKKSAEDLSQYLAEINVRARWLHSELKALERVELLRDLRLGEFDVLIGVNLLREGLDLPEVSLVAILDADKEGFLRSKSSLIQIVGRAARNACGEVVLYAERKTDAIRETLAVNEDYRQRQLAHNQRHGITPQTIKKSQTNRLLEAFGNPQRDVAQIVADELALQNLPLKELPKLVKKLEGEMLAAAKDLEFERAAQLRDQLRQLRELSASQKESRTVSGKSGK